MARTRRPPELVELSDGSRAVPVLISLRGTANPVHGLLVVEQGVAKNLLAIPDDEWISVDLSEVESVRPTNR